MFMKKYKRLLKKVLPYQLLTLLLFIYHFPLYFINRLKWEDWYLWEKVRRMYPEKKISCGNENTETTFYVIRRYSEVEGHFSMLSSILCHLLYAEENSWVSVVDLKNYHSQIWQSEELRGKENAWEYFYDQPNLVSIDDIESSKNIVLSDGR